MIDEHTRQCLAIHPAWSIRAIDVIMVVEAAIARYGVPEHLRSDNGPEFYRSAKKAIVISPRDAAVEERQLSQNRLRDAPTRFKMNK